MLPRGERMDLLEKFYMDRYDQARYKNTLGGGSYIPPSKLYDNPHYNNMNIKGMSIKYIRIHSLINFFRI
jgi:hypothetical protein